MNFVTKCSMILRSVTVSVLLISCIAWAQIGNKLTPDNNPEAGNTATPVNNLGFGNPLQLEDNPCDSVPCFTNVNDYLNGQHLLLAEDDLSYMTRASDGSPSLLHTDLSKNRNFTPGQVSIPQTGCTIFRGPKAARLFNTKNDWQVYLTGRPQDQSYCGSGPGNANIRLAWRDPSSTSPEKSEDFAITDLDNSQIIVADVNQDGYDDVVIIDSGLTKIYTAYDVNNPAAGLHQVAYSYFLNHAPVSHMDHQFGQVAIGDFNGDGAMDIIAPTYPNSSDPNRVWSMYGFSICPAKGFVLFANSDYQYTCTYPFEIHPRGDGVLMAGAFGTGPDGATQGRTEEPPRLAAGDFLGRSNVQTKQFQLFVDLVKCDATTNAIPYRRAQMWEFDPLLQPKLLSDNIVNGIPHADPPPYGDFGGWRYNHYVDFVTAARLHTGNETDADRDQVVMSTTDYLYDYRLFVVRYDNSGQISGQNTWNVYVNSFPLGPAPGFPYFGLTVGRFDPPPSNGNPNFDPQIAFYYQPLNNYGQVGDPGMVRTTFSVDNNWGFNQFSSQKITSAFNWKDTTYPGFDQFNGGLFTGDAQGRSVLVGTPLVVTIEDHIQPSMVLGIPPMHVDYIKDWQDNGPTVMNFTVYPAAFNTKYDFSTNVKGDHSDTNTTDANISYGEAVGGSLKLGNKDATGFSLDVKSAWKQSYSNSEETKNTHYSTLTKSVSATTGFADHIYFTTSRLNIYYYPVLGSKVCPEGNTCTTDQQQQLYIQYSGPDMIERDDFDATTQEWYQPVQEPGNVFSYPWSLAQMQLLPDGTKPTNPNLTPVSSNTTDDWHQTDTSGLADKTAWAGGGSAARTTGSVTTHNWDFGFTVAANKGIKDVYQVGGSFTFNYGKSDSLKTMNTETITMDASTGIQINKPNFGSPVANDYFYYYQGLILGHAPPPVATLFTPPTLQQSNGQPVDQQFFGPLVVAFLADPFHSGYSKWWKNAYGSPDIGLNHPARWNWDPDKKTVTFNAHEPLTDLPNPKTILNDVFYHMKGFFIGEASDDPNNSPQLSQATSGDVLLLRARVYNFSPTDMPSGSSVHVRFYGQLYDSEKASLSGDAFLIGEDKLAPLSGFHSLTTLGNSGNAANWKLASTKFNTTGYSGKFLVFWVVTWAEDGNGNLLAEQNGHGLTKNPRDLTFKQITDVPVEEYSNNVGMYDTYTPFYVAPDMNESVEDQSGNILRGKRRRTISSMAGGSGSLVQGDARSLQSSDVLVEATPVESRTERSWVTVTVHNTTGGELRSVPVVFYDGDPADDGKAFDLQRIPYMAADDTYALRTFFHPQISGRHDIYVRVGVEGAAARNPPAGTLMIP